MLGCLVSPTNHVAVWALIQSSFVFVLYSSLLLLLFVVWRVRRIASSPRSLYHVVFCPPGLSSSQVVVSGPAGFVFFAEGLLAEMGIPPQAVVLLD